MPPSESSEAIERLTDKVADLRARVRRLEDFIAGPRPACSECMIPMFPRVEDWKPGLVFSEESKAFMSAFHEWERNGSQGPCPRRPEKTYRPCRSCTGDGLRPETEEQRAQRIRLKVDAILPPE